MVAIKLNEDGRVAYVTAEEYATVDTFLVDHVPDGNIIDYKYINGDFHYDPLPKVEEPVVVSLEDRIAELSAKLDAITKYQGITVNKIGDGVYEVVKESMPTGDYTNPIVYTEGMSVTAGLFYYFASTDDVWECIKTGDGSTYSTEWFDVL